MTLADRAALAAELAVAGGRAAVAAGGGPAAEKDGRGNFVTPADVASERAILDLLAARCPADPVMSEESAPDTDPAAGRLWVIDPLDGTNNHRVGRNYAAVSVAYVEHGAAVAAAVYDPYRDELYAATAGGGATRNGRPLRLTTVRPLAAAAILTDNGYDPAVTRFNLGLYLRLDPSPWVLVRGSAVLGLCDVAGGRADLYFHTALKPWDVAAAALVVREAGGVMTAFDGRPAGLTDSAAVAGPADLVSEFLRQVGLPDTPRRTP